MVSVVIDLRCYLTWSYSGLSRGWYIPLRVGDREEGYELLEVRSFSSSSTEPRSGPL